MAPRMPEHDGVEIGRALTRREVLALLGASGAAFLAGRAGGSMAATPSCIVRSRQIEGPYFVDEGLERSDIRSDPATGIAPPGALLQLTFNVSSVRSGACRPLVGSHVDVWHCDARGVYSDVTDPEFRTVGQRFLRGYQVTDEAGVARFTTIYPGWYEGRTVHIHFKIRTNPTARVGDEFVSQLYFDDALTDRVHALAPYATRGPRRVRNGDDGIYRRGGDQLTLDVLENTRGYQATFDIGLRTT